jgi:hypothetical protein
MKTVLISLLFTVCLTAHAEDKAIGKQISGTVRLIRGSPSTEVFFKDLKDSAIIPKNNSHNAIYALCEESMKKGIPVSLIIHPISREVIAIPDKTESKTGPSASDSLPEGSK